jgi:protein-disulfide isomerase
MTSRPERAAERADRRRAEREARRQRRPRQADGGRPTLLWLSAGAIVIGLVAVIGFALLNRPPAPTTLVEPTVRTPTALADGLALGSADAPVTVEVWSDFQCPFCKRFTDDVEPLLVNDYVAPGKVRLVYRDMAFLGRGRSYDESLQAALAARCAARDNLFWAYHDYLFANQSGENRGAFGPTTLEAIAQAIGMDLTTFRTCLTDPAIAAQVADTQRAASAAGIDSTPTVMVDGERVATPFDYGALTQQIDQALAASPSP